MEDRVSSTSFSKPTLCIVCGLPGSGKTTLARELELQGALRLSPDEWIARIVGDYYDTNRRSSVEEVQLAVAERVLSLGLSVILDWGFWLREERDKMRELAVAVGADFRLYYLDVPLEDLVLRLSKRNELRLDATVHIEAFQIREWAEQFQKPTANECPYIYDQRNPTVKVIDLL